MGWCVLSQRLLGKQACPQPSSCKTEVDAYMHENDDYLVLIAAGNSGSTDFSMGSPATAKNILSVGAGFNTKEAIIAYKPEEATSRWRPILSSHEEIMPGKFCLQSAADWDASVYHEMTWPIISNTWPQICFPVQGCRVVSLTANAWHRPKDWLSQNTTVHPRK